MSKLRSLFRTSSRIEVVDGIHLTSIDYPDATLLAEKLNHVDFYQNTCSIPYPYTLADAQIFISGVIEYEKKNGIQRDWVVRNADGDLIGGIGLLYSHGLNAHRSEFGYWLAKEYWNQGIMTSVVKSFYQHIFFTTNLIRLEALVFAGNEGSCRVLEKAGFEKEGYLKKAYLKNGEFIDATLFAIIKKD